MATTLVRQPFGELSAARTQALLSLKNTQSAITDERVELPKSDFKPVLNSTFQLKQGQKRSFTSSTLDDRDSDAENVDPQMTSVKKSKTSNDTSSEKVHQPIFSLDLLSGTPQLSTTSVTRRASESKRATPYPIDTSSAFGATTAPAGRSPKHKRVGILTGKRLGFKRVNPPAFHLDALSGGAVPFSIDAALEGSLSRATKRVSTPKRASSAPMPKSWFFEIYEDKPGEEAATRMEHSTGNLDISDDETTAASKKDDSDKENVPPPDYVQGNLLAAQSRRSAGKDAMVDDGNERAALGDLEASEFYGAGLDSSSCVDVADKEDVREAESKDDAVPNVQVEVKDEPAAAAATTDA